MRTITIEAPCGRLRGLDRGDDLAFLGIRYAEPPVGERRFGAPVPARPFEGVCDATALPPSCPVMPTDPNGPIVLPEEPVDEDCLFLSVYTPAADDRRRPVLFWIHGGAFVVGSGRIFDGGPWCREEDLVVVSINYRLGPLGFLHLAHIDPGLEGSIDNGLRDQICALRWVRENIASLGGDPDRVTVFGGSAGAASVCALFACPEADGLFHRAIAQSPGGPPPVLDCAAWSAFTDAAIRNLGAEPGPSGLARLRSATPAELITAVLAELVRLTGPPPAPLPGVVTIPHTGPAVDGAVMTRTPAGAMRERGPGAVPLVIGTCRHEGTLLAMMLGVHEHTADEARAAFAAAGVDPDRAMEVYERVAPGSTPREKLVHAITDTLFRNYVLDLAAAMEAAGAPVWMYLLTVETDHYDGKLGATHGLEFVHQWDMIDRDPYWASFAGRNAPRELGPALRSIWAQFARSGRPALPCGAVWPRYDAARRATLILDRDLTIENDPDSDTRILWRR